MMKKSLCYSIITLAVTFVIGQVLLFLFPEGNSIGSSILFILMNLTPMFVAIAFAKSDGQKAVLKDMFFAKRVHLPIYLGNRQCMRILGCLIYNGKCIADRWNNYFCIGLYAMDNPARRIRRMWLEMVFTAKA